MIICWPRLGASSRELVLTKTVKIFDDERVRHFIENDQLEELVEKARPYAKIKELTTVNAKGKEFPVVSFVFGEEDPTLPTFGLFGGVHGLEKVGTHVALYFLQSFVSHLNWDADLRQRLKRCRLVSIPLVNPGGMYLHNRSNPNGVDLMRNAPQDALEKTPFLVGGHRYGPHLPWFRGSDKSELEKESNALVEFVREEMLQATTSFALDLHSGFGMVDRLWYPYAKTREDFPYREQAENMASLLNESHPYNVYKVEPQSDSYVTHGDLWDYLFDEHYRANKGTDNLFIPWTLEMGSWLWVKKNPQQLFRALGHFNPLKPHRYRRIMRRHMALLEFFFRATVNYSNWRQVA